MDENYLNALLFSSNVANTASNSIELKSCKIACICIYWKHCSSDNWKQTQWLDCKKSGRVKQIGAFQGRLNIMPPLTIAVCPIVVTNQRRKLAVKNSERECTSEGWSHSLAFQKAPQPHSISSRLLLKSMIFDLCCEFPPFEAETTLLCHPALYSTSFAEWFYDFMLHFGHFVHIFNFRSAGARAFTVKYATLEFQLNFQTSTSQPLRLSLLKECPSISCWNWFEITLI